MTNKTQSVWIICKPCPDPYYHGSPTGMVFTDEEAANAYLREYNGDGSGDPQNDHIRHHWEYYAEKGYLA